MSFLFGTYPTAAEPKLGEKLKAIAGNIQKLIENYQIYVHSEFMKHAIIAAKRDAAIGKFTCSINIDEIVEQIKKDTTHLASELIPAIDWIQLHERNEKAFNTALIAYSNLMSNDGPRLILLSWPIASV